MVVATYQTSAGTPGGQATAGFGGAWQTYPINTLVRNDLDIASITSNDILLPAGTYRIVSGSAFFIHWSRNNLRVIRTDTGAVLTDCMSVYKTESLDISAHPQLVPAEFTLQSATSIRFQYLVAYSSSSDSNDLGYIETDVTSASHNIYGYIYLERID